MTLRRTLSAEDQTTADKHKQLEQAAHKLREAVERFWTTFALPGLRDKLPLRFPSEMAEALNFRALSWYTYPG